MRALDFADVAEFYCVVEVGVVEVGNPSCKPLPSVLLLGHHALDLQG